MLKEDCSLRYSAVSRAASWTPFSSASVRRRDDWIKLSAALERLPLAAFGLYSLLTRERPLAGVDAVVFGLVLDGVDKVEWVVEGVDEQASSASVEASSDPSGVKKLLERVVIDAVALDT